MKDRGDLSGLPFIMGEQCRLSAKSARDLQNSSQAVRRDLDNSKNGISLPSQYSGKDSMKVEEILLERALPWKLENVAALEQIVLVENSKLRRFFMKKLEKFKGAASGRILAQRAVFDLDLEVREAAVEALKSRPAYDVDAILLDGLRYPWLPVVNNAALALVKLKRTGLAPSLVDLLDAPDPDAPFLGGPKNEQFMVRELVRINHHRNCLLCHPPAGESVNVKEVPLGPVPIPGQRMSSSASSYSIRRGDNVVRADITYLRQDFSTMLPVADSHPWPAEQRYDFFVRVRVLKDNEVLYLKNRNLGAETPYKNTIVLALRALTGQDGGYSSAAWRQLLDPRMERAWRSSCNK
jgi:hypothetical protein